MAIPELQAPGTTLAQRYEAVRERTTSLIRSLRPEDTVVQSMPDVSPTKWHLAHVTWFFERFVLEPHATGYRRFSEDYDFLFNSYYYTAGEMHARARRGLLSRPSLSEIFDYRASIDDAMLRLLDKPLTEDIVFATTIGLNHEQQHQELLLTDIKHVFSCNPTSPAVMPDLKTSTSAEVGAYTYSNGESGVRPIGAEEGAFVFDNETPRHEALLHPHRIGDRLVTNGEYREFVRDGGYRDPELWLSDGWALINQQNWDRPLYWDESLDAEFSLGGMRDLDVNSPVCHVSYYEADAFARWAGARLPTEFEWEAAARQHDVSGNLLESGYWHPTAGGSQFFGDVWEWTSSAYAPYPGFRALEGTLGEYNGKFMCNQMTVRGGSCVTANDHIRASYRSFFYPDARWQFLGLRLAGDAHA
jgi:ergothioneine biosynthesis protein EgtB